MKSIAFLLLAMVCLAGCSLRTEELVLTLDIEPDNDVADIWIGYLGLDTVASSRESKDVRLVMEAAAGKRLIGLIWGIDLDKAEQDPKVPPPLRKFVQRWKLAHHGLYLNKDGRLCGFQHFRIEGATGALAELNETLTEYVLLLERTKDLDDLGLDDASTKLWVARAHGKLPWFQLEGRDIIADLPMTRVQWDRLRDQLLDKIARRAGGDLRDALRVRDLFGQILSHLRELKIGDENVRIQLGPHSENGYRLSGRDPNPKDPYTGKLLTYLVEIGEVKFTPLEEAERILPDTLR